MSFRIFSMFTRAAPGSTRTSSSGNFRLITSAVAAAMGVHDPPVGPAEKTSLTFCWASGGHESESEQQRGGRQVYPSLVMN